MSLLVLCSIVYMDVIAEIIEVTVKISRPLFGYINYGTACKI